MPETLVLTPARGISMPRRLGFAGLLVAGVVGALAWYAALGWMVILIGVRAWAVVAG